MLHRHSVTWKLPCVAFVEFVLAASEKKHSPFPEQPLQRLTMTESTLDSPPWESRATNL